ncbi:FitA-like ribbon-helix-helix domain-containing protein [Candidatus Binatus sp.]|uniref:FitA-like ribbon-helix-helix domain-containing protein n=1 Tax=Candidatus Binatus sp. TaxID=2811406 RepID=UPI0039C8A6C3
MSVTLSIKNVPVELVKRLKRKAAMHKRSLHGELIAILEEATSPGRLTVEELWQEARRLGPPTPGDSTKMIREDRDSR